MDLKQLFQDCLNKEYTHTKDDVSFCCEFDNGTLKIYFQWSKGYKDWIANFNFPARPYKRMNRVWFIHRGFKRAWKSIEDIIKNYLELLEISQVQIVGYSHGAALAMLCHEFCKYHRPDLPIETYAFAPPRVLWGWWYKDLLKRWEGLTVIKNYDDIVTHLPPKCLGFRHVGEILNLTPSGFYNQRGKSLYERYILPHTEGEIKKQIDNLDKELK